MPAANYLECGSELKIKVELAFPLNASEEDMKATETTQVDEVGMAICHVVAELTYMYTDPWIRIYVHGIPGFLKKSLK